MLVVSYSPKLTPENKETMAYVRAVQNNHLHTIPSPAPEIKIYAYINHHLTYSKTNANRMHKQTSNKPILYLKFVGWSTDIWTSMDTCHLAPCLLQIKSH